MSKLLEDYLTEPALAAELDKSERTLQIWRAQSTGPAWTKIGKTVVYSRDAVIAWLKSRQYEPVRARRTA